MAGSFFDTNVLLYLASGDEVRAERVEQLLHSGGMISVQVLNESANVCRREMRLAWRETRAFLGTIQELLEVTPLTVEIHETALLIAERYRISVYDALIVASALDAGCDRLWSEDLQDGMRIDRRLRIINPFAGSRSG